MTLEELKTKVTELTNNVEAKPDFTENTLLIDSLERLKIFDWFIHKFNSTDKSTNMGFLKKHYNYHMLIVYLDDLKELNIIKYIPVKYIGDGSIRFEIISKSEYEDYLFNIYDFTLSKIESKESNQDRLKKCEYIKNIYSQLNLHSNIKTVSGKLFINGHYTQAIFEATKQIEIMVKNKSRLDKFGKDLMLTALSKNKPILQINDFTTKSEKDEQEGFMHIFAGAMQGIKNPKSHSDVKQNDPQRCIEYLCLCSLLAKIVDESKLKE